MFPAGDSRFRTRSIEISTPAGLLRIRAIECGDENAERVALCVHGWACSVYSFRLLMPLLAERGLRVVAIDLPGHGLSDKPSEAKYYTLDAQVECVLTSMDALGIARAVLIGHSMGGPISARIAVVAPDRVTSLVLLAPAGFGSEWTIKIGAALTPRFIAPVLPYLVPRWTFALVLYLAYGRLRSANATDVDEYWAPTQFPAFVRATWDLLHHFDWSAGVQSGFETITAPTVVVDGSEDRFVVRRWVKRYAQVVRHATFIAVEGCGHVVAEEAPERVLAAVRALID